MKRNGVERKKKRKLEKEDQEKRGEDENSY